MALIDDEPRPLSRSHQIGQELSLLSVGELQERIALLHTEIERLETELKSKGATKAAAEALFKS